MIQLIRLKIGLIDLVSKNANYRKISSSSWISIVPRNQDNDFCARTSFPWIINVYFGDSGHNGKVKNWKAAGTIMIAEERKWTKLKLEISLNITQCKYNVSNYIPNSQGHFSSVPKKLGRPNTLESRIEIVITNW